MTTWDFKWPHGTFSLHSKGGMLGGLSFRLADGRQASPLYEAPWLDEGRGLSPRLLENLRNEFPCVPFGVSYSPDTVDENWRESVSGSDFPADQVLDASDELLHGYGSEGEWSLVEKKAEYISIGIDYPPSSPISRLERKITADPASPMITFTLTIHTRRPCRRPVGVHPNFALSTTGSMEIDTDGFAFGVVHPAGPEAGISQADPGAIFASLEHVPLSNSRTADFRKVPFAHDTEEIVQLCGINGEVRLTDRQQDVSYRLSWDAETLPSLLLWMSNRGRKHEPWSGRNLCLGVEPVAAAFDLGTVAGLSPNPINERGIPTSLELSPSEPCEIRYALQARANSDQ